MTSLLGHISRKISDRGQEISITICGDVAERLKAAVC